MAVAGVMKIKKILTLITVVLAGEAIFMHPFLVPRLYRSLMMEVWDLNNVQIGLAFTAYGITAMFSYVLGGPFADKFEPRRLIVVSLLITVLGSGLLLYRPSAMIFIIAYGFFWSKHNLSHVECDAKGNASNRGKRITCFCNGGA